MEEWVPEEKSFIKSSEFKYRIIVYYELRRRIVIYHIPHVVMKSISNNYTWNMIYDNLSTNLKNLK
jgi:hypothetical protein